MPEFYTSMAEAAEAIDVSAQTISRWKNNGRLKTYPDTARRSAGRPGTIIYYADLVEAKRADKLAEVRPDAGPLTLLPVEDEKAAALALQVIWPEEHRAEPYGMEILEGFKEFRAVTYSASIPTVLTLLEQGGYDRFEVVFGNPDLVKASTPMQVIQAQAGVDMELTANWWALGGVNNADAARLLEWQASGTARFMVFGGGINHSKYYLLEKPGLRRVMLGSANLSRQAFSGRQGEVLVAFDNNPFMWGLVESKFSSLWQFALPMPVRNVPVKEMCLTPLDTPIMRHLQESPDDETVELTVYHASDAVGITHYTNATQDELKSWGLLSEALPLPEKGVARLKKANIKLVKSLLEKQVKDNDIVRPHRLDFAMGSYAYDGARIERPAEDDSRIAHDALVITEYLDKLREFGPGYQSIQRGYFAFMGWLYFAPFMPRLRSRLEAAGRTAKSESKLAAVIYGPPNAGKTGLVKFLFRSMFGDDPQVLGNFEFTAKRVDNRWKNAGYLPLWYDDISSARFANPYGKSQPAGEDIVRAYDRCGDRYPGGYPALVAVANQEAYDYSEAARERLFMVYAYPGLPGYDSALKTRLANETARLQNRIGTALYAEYLHRMEKGSPMPTLPPLITCWNPPALSGIFWRRPGCSAQRKPAVRSGSTRFTARNTMTAPGICNGGKRNPAWAWKPLRLTGCRKAGNGRFWRGG